MNGVPKPRKVKRKPILALAAWRSGDITCSASECRARRVAANPSGRGASPAGTNHRWAHQAHRSGPSSTSVSHTSAQVRAPATGAPLPKRSVCQLVAPEAKESRKTLASACSYLCPLSR